MPDYIVKPERIDLQIRKKKRRERGRARRVTHVRLITGGILQNYVGIFHIGLPGFGQGILYYLDVKDPGQLSSDPDNDFKISKLLWPQEDPAE